jgi:hypothetical protein
MLNNPFNPGEYYVPAYQASATPWVTSSQITLGTITEIDFLNVARFVVIKNSTVTGSGTQLAVGFTRNGLNTYNSNFFILRDGESFAADLRVDRVFLSGSAGATTNFTVIAGLTNIGSPINNPGYFSVPSASNGFNGVG